MVLWKLVQTVLMLSDQHLCEEGLEACWGQLV